MASKKHKTFVDEPIEGKPLTALPGVGKKMSGKLKNADIPDAKALLGGFLPVEGNKTRFYQWMKEKCDANKRHADECYACLEAWSGCNIPQLRELTNELVTKIPCLQGPLSERLSKTGFRYAKALFGKYLQLGEDRTRFTEWLVGTHEAEDIQAAQCFTFLQKWSAQHFRERNPSLAAGAGVGASKKSRTFASEPMGDKAVNLLPGIGPATATKMKNAGVHKAVQVWRQWIKFDEDQVKFTTWLTETFDASRKSAEACFDGLKDYDQQNPK